MKKIYISIIAVISSLLFANVIQAQDPNYSQFYLKETYYNPAMTGINPGLRGTITDRHLWTSVPGEWGTQSVCFDYYDNKFAQGGIGAFLTRSTQGENFLNTFQGGLAYAKQIRVLPDLMFQIGAGAQYIHKSLDYSNMIFTDQLDPRFGAIYETEFQLPTGQDYGSQGVLDYNAGTAVQFNIRQTPVKYLATGVFGVAFHHLSQPDMSWLDDGQEAPLPMKFSAHGYMQFRINRQGFHNRYFLICPGFIFENQAEANQWFKGSVSGAKTLTFGMNTTIPSKVSFMSSLYLGMWCRKQYYKKESLEEIASSLKAKSFDALILTVGYIKYSKDKKQLYQFLYSYDMTISNAGLSTGGTHEVTLSFEIHDLAIKGATKRRSAVPHPNEKFLK